MTELGLRASGECQVCTNGDLRFAIRSADGRCFVECLECMTGYLDAEDLAASPTFRVEDMLLAPADYGDVVRAGWEPLLLYPAT